MIRMKYRLLATIATALSVAATAQTAPPPSNLDQPSAAVQTSPVAVSDGAAGDIIVTARKRSESAQTIPISIEAVSQAALNKNGTLNLQDLPKLAPGLNLTRAPNENQVGITIRGLGTNAGVPSFDSSVSLFVDGVYAPRSREFTASLFDIERIEVISGTQAALLGKNTSLGAVSLITRKPGDTFEADVRGSYEFELNSPSITGGVDIPLTDRLQVRVSGLADHLGGWVKNVVTNRYEQSSNDEAFRGVAVWKPIDTLSLTGVAQHFHGRNIGDPAEQIASDGTPEILSAIAGYPGAVELKLDRHTANTLTFNGGEQSETIDVNKYSLTSSLELGEHTVTSVTGYSDYHEQAVADLDYVPGGYAIQNVNETGHQVSEEIRLVSPSGRRFEYLVGGLFLDGTLNNQTIFTTNYPFDPIPNTPFAGSEQTNFYQETTDYSAFAQGTYAILDKLKATGGIRFTNERKDVTLGRNILIPGFFSFAVFPPYAPASLSRSENDFDYSGGLQYSFSRNALIYASYGKGTKGGGFAQSVTQLDKTEYAKEVSRTEEVGVKLSDPGHEWLLNVSLFNTNVDGFQVVSFTGVQFVVVNTDLRSRGFELQSYWYPVDWLRLYANNTYADAHDRHTGGPIPLAPKWTGTGGFDIDQPLPTLFGRRGLRFKLDGSVNWRSSRYYQQNPLTSPPAGSFTTFDLGAAIASAGDKYELRLIGRNITNANSIAFDFPTPFIPAGNQTAISERPRTIALQLSVRY